MAKKIKAASSYEPLEEETKQASREESTVNLDEYGIWVKAEPEDFKADDSFDENEMALEDLSPEEAGEAENMESEGGLIDDLDIPEEESLAGLGENGDEPSLELGETGDEVSLELEESGDEASLELEESGDEPSLELGETGDEALLEIEEEPIGAPVETAAEEAVQEPSGASVDEEMPALEEEEMLEEDFGSLEMDAEVPAAEEETVVRDEAESPSLEPITPEAEPLDETGQEAMGGGGDFEEVSLDDLGIEISAEPPAEDAPKKQAQAQEPAPAHAADEATPHVIDDEFASLSLELEDEGGAGEPVEEKGSLELGELELPEEEETELAPSLEEASGESAAVEETFEDLTGPETLEEIPELELGAEETVELETEPEEGGDEIEVPLSEEVSIAESEEDLANLEPELETAGEAAPSGSILKNIEAELRSIKAELTQLKSELGVLRGKKADGEHADRKTGADEAGADFFEDEEDETIALTGEELDNIMTTADIKEETKAGTAVHESGTAEQAPEETELELGEDIIGYEEAAAPEEPSPRPAGEEAEELSFDEVESDMTAGDIGADWEKAGQESPASEGEIEIEIPELESGPEEMVAEEPFEGTAQAEDLGQAEGLELESMEAPSLEETLEEAEELELEPVPEEQTAPVAQAGAPGMELPSGLKEEIKSVLGYMDQLLESLPEEKIEEFAKSEYFSIYKKLFEELGLVS